MGDLLLRTEGVLWAFKLIWRVLEGEDAGSGDCPLIQCYLGRPSTQPLPETSYPLHNDCSVHALLDMAWNRVRQDIFPGPQVDLQEGQVAWLDEVCLANKGAPSTMSPTT